MPLSGARSGPFRIPIYNSCIIRVNFGVGMYPYLQYDTVFTVYVTQPFNDIGGKRNYCKTFLLPAVGGPRSRAGWEGVGGKHYPQRRVYPILSPANRAAGAMTPRPPSKTSTRTAGAVTLPTLTSLPIPRGTPQ